MTYVRFTIYYLFLSNYSFWLIFEQAVWFFTVTEITTWNSGISLSENFHRWRYFERAVCNTFSNNSICDKPQTGHHKCANYWMGHINLVNLYHVFSKGIKSVELALFSRCLPKLTEFSFLYLTIITSKI